MSFHCNIRRPVFLIAAIWLLSSLLLAARAQPALDQLSDETMVAEFVENTGVLSGDSLMVLLVRYVDHLRRRKPAGHAAIGELYLHYAKTFHSSTGIDSIARYLDLAEAAIARAEHPCKAYLLWAYEAGRHAYEKNDYELSLNRLVTGLEYLKTHFPDDITQELQFRNGIGIGYRRTGQPEKAVQCFREGIRRMEENNLSNLTKGNFYNNMGLAYMDMGSFPEAIAEIRNALDFYVNQISPEYLEIGTGYDNLGICYEKLGMVDSAKYYYTVSLYFIENVLSRQHPDLLSPLASLTELHMSQGELSEAGTYHERAIILLNHLGWAENDPSGNFLLDEAFRNLANGIHLYHLLYAGSGDLMHLNKAEEFIDGFIATTDYAFEQFSNSLSRQIFLEDFKEVFVEGVDVLFVKYNRTTAFRVLEKAFHISEKYKSLELLHAARKSSVNKDPAYAELDKQYRQFLDSIAFYEQILYEKKNTLDIEITRIENHIHKLKESLYSWKDRVQDNYPEYYQLIYQASAPSILRIRDMCRINKQAILSFVLGKEAVYSFLIRSDTILFTKSIVSGSPASFIMDFREALTGFHAEHYYSDEMYLKYLGRISRLGTYLYNLLIYPVEYFIPPRVTIIVDQELALLPFDALIKTAPERPGRFRNYDFLLHHHTISYGYSVTLWIEMMRKQAAGTNRLLAFAPSFSAETGQESSEESAFVQQSKFNDLKYNQDEVVQIGDIFRSRILTGEEATKDAFISLGGDYGILHLATHSVVDPENGEQTYLAFYPGNDSSLLYAREMYSMPLKAELVTLSACETGVGEIRAGEGVISLARAFSYAGARSIVNSLWPVNDMSTSQVMKYFYANLKKGLPKDLALQEARIDYIESQAHTEAHPYFWAGFIPAGNMQPIKGQGAIPQWLIFAGLYFLLLMMIYFALKFFSR